MPGSRPFRALDYARMICYHVYNEFFINQASAFPTIRKGAFALGRGADMAVAIAFTIGLFIGAFMGLVVAACCVISRRDD